MVPFEKWLIFSLHSECFIKVNKINDACYEAHCKRSYYSGIDACSIN